MKTFNVELLSGFNGIKFGMDRSQVRSILGNPIKEFKKSKFSKTFTDDYTDFHIFYDAEDKFEAVEFFENTEITVNDTIIFPISVSALANTPYIFSTEGDGLISKVYSIGIYIPDGKPESILFGKKDYYL